LIATSVLERQSLLATEAGARVKRLADRERGVLQAVDVFRASESLWAGTFSAVAEEKAGGAARLAAMKAMLAGKSG